MSRAGSRGHNSARTPIVTGDSDVDSALLELAEILAAIGHDGDPANLEVSDAEPAPHQAESRKRGRRKNEAHR